MNNAPLDSPEGMRILVQWARGNNIVLSEWHEKLAQKHGIDTTGVRISRQIPMSPKLMRTLYRSE